MSDARPLAVAVVATTVLAVAAVLPLLRPGPPAPSASVPTTNFAAPAARGGPTECYALAVRLGDTAGERSAVPVVRGVVIDPKGRPVAGVRVAVEGSTAVIATEADGTFAFAGARPGACRALPAAGWLALESPLLGLCQASDRTILVVAPCAELTGQVLDGDGGGVAGASVAVELDVDLPAGAIAAGLRVSDAWTTVTDADGWYRLPQAPIGTGARLIADAAGERATVDLPRDRWAYHHVQLTRRAVGDAAAAADPGPIAIEPTGPDRSGDAATVSGVLRDENGQPRTGWWVALSRADARAALDQPGTFGRFASAPVTVAADGRFRFGGVAPGAYRVEAWEPHNQAVVRSAPFAAPVVDLELRDDVLRLPGRIRGRLVDERGAPLAGARVGLARPTAWAVPGGSAMHLESAVTTERDGTFAVTTGDFAALELRVDDEGVLPLRAGVGFEDAQGPIELRAQSRRWIAMTPNAADARLPGDTRLVALDCGDHELPIWVGGSSMPAVAVPWSAPSPAAGSSATDRLGVSGAATRLVARAGGRDLGWLRLLP